MEKMLQLGLMAALLLLVGVLMELRFSAMRNRAHAAETERAKLQGQLSGVTGCIPVLEHQIEVLQNRMELVLNRFTAMQQMGFQWIDNDPASSSEVTEEAWGTRDADRRRMEQRQRDEQHSP